MSRPVPLRVRGSRAGFRQLARLRHAPAFHPDGLTCTGELAMPGPQGTAWGVPWLDGLGRYECVVRLSRGAGLPRPLPDWLGLAVRALDAGGPGRPVDLLLTSSARPPVLRRLPPAARRRAGRPVQQSAHLPGRRARHGAGRLPAPSRLRPVHGSPPALRRALVDGPLVFDLRAAELTGRWRTFAVLTVRSPLREPPRSTPGFDVHRNSLPELAPGTAFAAVRPAAYEGSREGRG
ncbi:phosphodiesterase [Streptomyces radiopugnans]|nr:phosphodiesterase [Streptomyces radiopugnans]